jgi:Flp pilus assembly protein TadG
MIMKRWSRRRSGQALIETALVVVPLVLLGIGIVQFGYSFMQLNMIANATRDGARQAAAFPQRDGCGCIRASDKTLITDPSTGTVINQLRSVFDATTLSSFTVTVEQLTGGVATALCTGGCPCTSATCSPTGSDPPTVRVTVTGSVNYLFNFSLWFAGSSWQVNRQVAFRDELRAQPGG